MNDLRSPEPGPNPWPVKVRHFLMREWPYLAMLVLAMFGVAYTSVTRRPMTLYWLALAPFIGFVCVLTRWSAMKDRDQRLHLVWTQALHWGAVLAAMNLLYVADVGQMMSTDSRALYVLTLLALGTFTAGVHIGAWRICLVGVILAIGVPAIAWLEQSALLLLLAGIVVIGMGAPLWWRYTKGSAAAP
jgi:hypothetical protein